VPAPRIRLASLAALLSLAACSAPHPKNPNVAVPAPHPKNLDVEVPAPPLAGGSVESFAAAVASDAQRSDTEGDARVREQLAAEAESAAQACLQLSPRAAACLYYHGVALGLQARAHPLRANELLKSMLDSLTAAEADDPGYDHAGPERVKALVLVRAPGWPLGPGDLDTGVAEARRAVQLSPQHPPNQLALAEALSKSGDAAGAHEAYQRAQSLAQDLPASADRADWLKQADQGLSR
jgi:tetratricopeptide (TPR) repeat protein